MEPLRFHEKFIKPASICTAVFPRLAACIVFEAIEYRKPIGSVSSTIMIYYLPCLSLAICNSLLLFLHQVEQGAFGGVIRVHENLHHPQTLPVLQLIIRQHFL